MVLQLSIRPNTTPETHDDLAYVFAPDDVLCRSGAAQDISRERLLFHHANELQDDPEGSPDRHVFTGMLYRDGAPDTPVVCKLALGSFFVRACRYEAERYQKELLDLQGHFIPKVYGFYTGEVEGRPAACILLEHCGVRPSRWTAVPIELRAKAIEILMAIHDRGLQHNDFQTDNVIVDSADKPSRIFVVDFDNAMPHQCARKKPIMLYDIAIHTAEFECDELCEAANDTAVWTPATLPFDGKSVSVRDVWNAETLLAKHGGENLLSRDRESALSVAQNAIDDYCDEWDHRMDYITGEIPCRELRPAVPPSV